MTVLNTIVAEAVDAIADELEASGTAGKARPGEHTAAFHDALQGILQKSLEAHKRVVFNGNGYEPGWTKEAAKRGLPAAPDTPSALAALARPENVSLCEKYGVMTKRELESRREIFLEEYEKKIRIEAACACDIARTMILPAVRSEYAEVLRTYNETDASNVKTALDMLRGRISKLADGLVALQNSIDALGVALDAENSADTLKYMAELRTAADALEAVVPSSRWPLPKYREMLFLY